jgi:hypothetical protein
MYTGAIAQNIKESENDVFMECYHKLLITIYVGRGGGATGQTSHGTRFLGVFCESAILSFMVNIFLPWVSDFVQ